MDNLLCKFLVYICVHLLCAGEITHIDPYRCTNVFCRNMYSCMSSKFIIYLCHPWCFREFNNLKYSFIAIVTCFSVNNCSEWQNQKCNEENIGLQHYQAVFSLSSVVTSLWREVNSKCLKLKSPAQIVTKHLHPAALFMPSQETLLSEAACSFSPVLQTSIHRLMQITSDTVLEH